MTTGSGKVFREASPKRSRSVRNAGRKQRSSRRFAVGALLAAVVAIWFPSTSATADADVDADVVAKNFEPSGWTDAGAFGATLLYGPAKLAYAATGAVVSGLAWIVSGGNGEAAKNIAEPAMRGDYVITAAHIRGARAIQFVGQPSVDATGPGEPATLIAPSTPTAHTTPMTPSTATPPTEPTEPTEPTTAPKINSARNPDADFATIWLASTPQQDFSPMVPQRVDLPAQVEQRGDEPVPVDPAADLPKTSQRQSTVWVYDPPEKENQ